MAYTLEQLAADCRAALRADPGLAGREKIKGYVEKALRDDAFQAAQLGSNASKEREIIHEDAELGFCICRHAHDGARQGFPHDHGPTWAIYGQAEGETKMTDWELKIPPNGDEPGQAVVTRTYHMKPGDVHFYDVGDIHAPYRDGPTKLLRIEGTNTEHVTRDKIVAAE